MKRIVYFIALITFWGVLSCSREENPAAYIPVAPDYSEEEMWYNVMNDKGEGVDIFYVVSTWEFDWLAEGGVISHYADVFNQHHRDNMDIEIKKF